MATTTNFGWETPDDTDLVKDGAAAMRTLGNSIDASFVDLKGGTTDQVLAKNSNSDLDFKWVAQDDSNAIQNAIVDAKGDLISATAADTPARLAVGANGTVLTADSAQATGLKWAAAASGVTSWSLLNAGGTALTGATSITISGISNQKELLICVDSGSSATASAEFYIRPNAVSAADYSVFGWRYIQQATYGSNNSTYATYTGGTEIPFGRMGNAAANSISGSVYLTNCDTTGWKRFISTAGGSGDSTGRLDVYQGLWEASAAVTSIEIVSSAGNFDAGTIYVFGGV